MNCLFQLGQKVIVRPEFPFYDDFQDGPFMVVGMRLVDGEVDIEIATEKELAERIWGTDGFRAEDLEPV